MAGEEFATSGITVSGTAADDVAVERVMVRLNRRHWQRAVSVMRSTV